jgi:hypothetical protein
MTAPSVVTVLSPNGRPLAVKKAVAPIDVERLKHEATVLGLIDHPGVVELVALDDTDDGTLLATAHAGNHSLATIGPLRDEQVAALVAGLAGTLADLHDLGLVHGRVEPSHVLVGADGTPRLCGFAGAGAPGEIPFPATPRARAHADPACPAGSPLIPATDVHGIGTILKALLGEDVDPEPIPDRRFTRPRDRLPWSGYHRRALLTLADQATADDPADRPGARALAAAIAATVPTNDRHTGTDVEAHARPPSRAQIRRVGVAAIALTGAILVWVGVTSLGGLDGRAPGVSEGTIGTATTTPVVAPARIDCPSVDATIAADVDGDGCDDAVTADSGVLTVAGSRYELGDPGDAIVLGDWDCDGRATAAVVRPVTGEVFLFAGWAEPTADLVSHSLPFLAPPGVPRADDADGDGCSALVVDTPAGTEQVWPQVPPAGGG